MRTPLEYADIVDSVLARSINRGHLDELIDERLTKIMDMEDTTIVMTSNILGNRALITQSLDS